MGLYDLLYRVGCMPWERAGEAYGTVELEGRLTDLGIPPGSIDLFIDVG